MKHSDVIPHGRPAPEPQPVAQAKRAASERHIPVDPEAIAARLVALGFPARDV